MERSDFTDEEWEKLEEAVSLYLENNKDVAQEIYSSIENLNKTAIFKKEQQNLVV